LQDGSLITSIALVFPETIAISVNGRGIMLYDYLTLTQKTSLSAQAVSVILLTSTRLACIDSQKMIRTWSLYDHGSKSRFHGLLWKHTHDIQDLLFYKDMIVSIDKYECILWSWNKKCPIKVINSGIHRAIIYRNLVCLFSTQDLQIFRHKNNQISKLHHYPLSFIIKGYDQFVFNSDSIIVKTRLTEHKYSIC
jgi:hypothetical protein